jgi:hypothetical protein
LAPSNNLKQLTEREERILAAIREGLLGQTEGRGNALKVPPVFFDGENAPVEPAKVVGPSFKPTQPEVGDINIECRSPSITPDLLMDPVPQAGSWKRDGLLKRRPLVAGRLLRICFQGIFVIGVVSSLLAFPSYEAQLKKVVFAARDYLASQLEALRHSRASIGSDLTSLRS